MVMRLSLVLSVGLAACGGGPPPGSPCTKDADCGTYQSCGFALAAGCAAKGTCIDDPSKQPGTAHCQSIAVECGCDGSKVGVRCDFPSGYAPAPIKDQSGLSCR